MAHRVFLQLEAPRDPKKTKFIKFKHPKDVFVVFSIDNYTLKVFFWLCLFEREREREVLLDKKWKVGVGAPTPQSHRFICKFQVRQSNPFRKRPLQLFFVVSFIQIVV